MLKKNNQSNNSNKIQPNYELMENSIKQGTILLNDNKKKNESLKQKIIELEKRNKDLNYKLIEANQKLKRALNMNNSKNMNTNDEINRLNNIVDENEIKVSKLELDKKALEQKLDEYQKSHENELKLMLDYKNSELAVYQNIIDKYKNNNSDFKNNFNLLNNNNGNGNNDMTLKNFQNQLNKMKQEINSKIRQLIY